MTYFCHLEKVAGMSDLIFIKKITKSVKARVINV